MAADTTIRKTLWSETLLEMLYDALEGNRPDYVVLELLTDLAAKGMKQGELIREVENHASSRSAARVKRLLGK